MGASASMRADEDEEPEVGFASIIGGALNYKSWLDDRMVRLSLSLTLSLSA